MFEAIYGQKGFEFAYHWDVPTAKRYKPTFFEQNNKK
jgi:hypothetical protein